MPSSCCIPGCMYSRPKRKRQDNESFRSIFTIRRPEFIKSEDEKKQHENMTNLVLTLRGDASKGDRIKFLLHKQVAAICEIHFEDEDIIVSKSKKVLKIGALPTKHLPSKHRVWDLNPCTMEGVESSAIKILTRAVELEQGARLQPALTCYQEGIDLLLEVVKSCTDPDKKKKYREKLYEYMARAEQIKETVKKQKDEGKYHEQIHIKEDDTNYGYDKIFGPYLDHTVTEALIEDAYIRNFAQVNNFLQLCELLVYKCKNLQKLQLTTTRDHGQQQSQNLENIQKSLLKRNIVLTVVYSDSLHDREIRLNNGWIIKIGRGLDYFKRVEKCSIGIHNLNLRLCHSTTVDVFHSKFTKESSQQSESVKTH